MRRLTLLVVALAIALAGARLLVAAESMTGATLRDAGLLLALGALVFAVNAVRPAVRVPQAVSDDWPVPGRVLALGGLVSAVAGGLLFVVDDPGGVMRSARLTLWLLGLFLLLAGVWWRGAVQRYSQPGYRWQRHADGSFARVPVGPTHLVPHITTDVRLPAIWVVAVFAGAFLLRAWPMFAAPTTCAGNECRVAMALMADTVASEPQNPFNPLFVLTWLLNLALDNPLLSTRIAALFIGMATLVVAWPTLRPRFNPATATLGIALLALNPVHIAAGHQAVPWLPLPLTLLGVLWAVYRGRHTGDRRAWTIAGLALGAAALTAPALVPGLAMMALAALGVGITHQRDWIGPWRALPLLLFLGALVATVLPLAAVQFGNMQTSAESTHAASLPLSPVGVALVTMGLGVQVRYIRLAESAFVLAATVGLGMALLLANIPVLAASLALLAPALVAGTLALDELLDALVVSWRVLVRPSRLAMGLAALVLLPLLGSGIAPVVQSDVSGPAAPDPIARAVIAAAHQALLSESDVDRQAGAAEDAMLIYLPDDVLTTPEAQIGLGPWIAQGRILPLRSDTLLDGVGATQRVFLTPDALAWSDVLRAYFPRSTEVPVYDEGAGTVLYWILALVPEPGDGPGLTAVYADGATAEAVTIRTETDTEIMLGSDLPEHLDATWRGTLRVPGAGTYRFDVTGLTPSDVFTLLIDDKLLLDTSLDRPVGIEVLAAGLHRLEARLRSKDKPATLAIRWAPADGEPMPVTGDVLFTRALPQFGLEATYFANAGTQPPGVDLRRDLFFDTVAMEMPFSVSWRGKLAANRAGEYMLAIVADGDAELMLDGAQLAANRNLSGEGATPGYAEGVAYLDSGWHDLEVRFAPASETAALTLLWQPPGGRADVLSPLYLLPFDGALSVQDVPLPPAPALSDPRLERDGFALTQGVDMRRPQTVRLAQNAPLLGQLVWEAATGCGDRPGQLARPHGVAVDPLRSRIYVADTGNAQIARFTLDGAPLEPVVAPQLQEPVDVAVAADGAVFVLDAGTQQVLQWDPKSELLVPLVGGATFYRPRGLATTDDGWLAVADTGGARVVLLDPTNGQVLEFGGMGSALGRGQPVDVMQAGDALWTVTSEDGRLWNLTVDGSVVATQPAVSSDGSHLAARPDGSFFVSDPTRATVHYHGANGRPLRSFAYPDAFAEPTGIAVFEAGNEVRLIVVDSERCGLSAWRLPMSTLE